LNHAAGISIPAPRRGYRVNSDRPSRKTPPLILLAARAETGIREIEREREGKQRKRKRERERETRSNRNELSGGECFVCSGESAHAKQGQQAEMRRIDIKRINSSPAIKYGV